MHETIIAAAPIRAVPPKPSSKEFVTFQSFDSPRRPLADLVQLCRPTQWTKNVFVLGPLLFSESLGRPEEVFAALTAFAVFCLLCSAIYCVNDVIDAAADRQHPRKRQRPVASGRVSPRTACLLALALGGISFAVAAVLLPPTFLVLAGLYVGNSLVYVLFLKQRVIADVIGIALGFVLRLLAGCAAIVVHPTSWILVCGFSLAMILGLGKRRLEIDTVAAASPYRPTLRSYGAEKLNLLLGVMSSVCLLSYMLYTVAAETIRLHGTDRLVYSVPFVAYGIFRYVFKVQEGGHDGPVEVLLRDRVFALNGLLWLTTVAVILYVKP